MPKPGSPSTEQRRGPRPVDGDPRLLDFARAATVVAAAIAAVTLWGWALGAAELRHFGARVVPMPPAGAIGFLLVACSFYAAQKEDARSRRGARVAAALAVLLSLL